MKLNSHNEQTIINALVVAADAYRKDAATSRAAGHERIAAQFDRQRTEALWLAERIANEGIDGVA